MMTHRRQRRVRGDHPLVPQDLPCLPSDAFPTSGPRLPGMPIAFVVG